MICARCDKPILDSEESVPVDNMAPTGPGSTVYIHAVPCRRAQIQTTPHHKWWSARTRRPGSL